MLKVSLFQKIFEAFSIQRWNDKMRPVDLTEMDKHAHKMFIAYCLAKYEEGNGKTIHWSNIIKGGIFELLRRIVISDIKSPVYNKIQDEHKEVFLELNNWAYDQLKPIILSSDIRKELKEYLINGEILDPLSCDILAAAHIYATYWEFLIIKQTDPHGYEISEIESRLLNNLERYLNLSGMRKILTKARVSNFIDLVGRLRFQVRWSQTPRIPITSVLGHSLMVAIISYFFSREFKSCEERIKNNFFGGLFHDLPEAVTRDIPHPVKKSVPGFPKAIAEIEKELVRKEIHSLIEDRWIDDFKYYTEDEFKSKIKKDGNIQFLTTNEINEKYNENHYKPMDGEITKVADDLAAFVEAHSAIEVGITTNHLKEGKRRIVDKNRDRIVGGVSIGSIYADFVD